MVESAAARATADATQAWHSGLSSASGATHVVPGESEDTAADDADDSPENTPDPADEEGSQIVLAQTPGVPARPGDDQAVHPVRDRALLRNRIAA